MTNSKRAVAILVAIITSIHVLEGAQQAQPPALTEAGQKLQAGYAAQIQALKAEIENALPRIDEPNRATLM